jgi:hypothetical protein
MKNQKLKRTATQMIIFAYLCVGENFRTKGI